MDKQVAWIYCHIDAPEDVHGALKGQYRRLEAYAAQMGFAVVGSSQDLGIGLHFDRSGLQSLLKAAQTGIFQILLVDSASRIERDMAQTKKFIKTIANCGVRIYSPLEGEIKRPDYQLSLDQEELL